MAPALVAALVLVGLHVLLRLGELALVALAASAGAQTGTAPVFGLLAVGIWAWAFWALLQRRESGRRSALWLGGISLVFSLIQVAQSLPAAGLGAVALALNGGGALISAGLVALLSLGSVKAEMRAP